MEFNRDSLLIPHTIKSFIQSGYRNYKNYHVDSSYNSIDEISIDLILYDPSMLKMISFVIIKEPPTKYFSKTSFDAKAIVGYRTNQDSIWTIYPYTGFITSRILTYERAVYLIRKFYFKEFYDTGEYIKGKNGELVYKKFQCNVLEPKFWNSIVWEIGARVDGYYNFQTKYNIRARGKSPIIEPLKIDYPNEIKELYK